MEAARRASCAEVQASAILSKQVNRISVEIVRKSADIPKEDEQKSENLDFKPSHGLTTEEANELLKKWGRNELVEKITPTWLIIFRLVSV